MDIKHVNVKFLYSVKYTYDIPSTIYSFFFFFAIYSAVLGNTLIFKLGSHTSLILRKWGWWRVRGKL